MRSTFSPRGVVLAMCYAAIAAAAVSCASKRPVRATSSPSPSFAGKPAAADKNSYLANLVAELRKKWPSNRTINIVCHGHSVPAGYFKTPDVRTFDAYPFLLHQGLKERFPYAVLNLIVTAIGGENSEQGAARFERDVLSLRPDLVTIDYALNDRGIGLERARRAWEAMIQKALAHGVKVILLTPTPDQSANLDDPKDPLNQHAAQIRALAAQYDVGLVDSLERFGERVHAGEQLKNLMAQVNHPNRRGHELVAEGLLEWFPAPPTDGTDADGRNAMSESQP